MGKWLLIRGKKKTIEKFKSPGLKVVVVAYKRWSQAVLTIMISLKNLSLKFPCLERYLKA